MKPEDIKVGETYYVRVKADRYEVDGAYFQLIDENGHGDKGYRFYSCCYYAFLPTPTPPKYDPCRKLKVGDVVRVLKINGNLPKCKWAGNTPKEGVTGIVRELREGDHFVWIDVNDIDIVCYCIDPAYLELVTPVEERKPFFVFEDATSWQVKKGNSLCARYGKATHPRAKEAAEAECDRLNAEHRKERK